MEWEEIRKEEVYENFQKEWHELPGDGLFKIFKKLCDIERGIDDIYSRVEDL